MNEQLVKKVAELLSQYESDAPYVNFDGSHDEVSESGWDWDTIVKYSQEKHHGDCIGFPMTCSRCVAEDLIHKSQWIAERLEKEFQKDSFEDKLRAFGQGLEMENLESAIEGLDVTNWKKLGQLLKDRIINLTEK